jgi:hypothetical protein
MKLLTSVLPRSGRLLPAGGWFTVAICGYLVGLEIAGRYAATDFQDGLAASTLLAVLLAVTLRHRREPLGWVQGLGKWGKWLGGPLTSLRYDHGIDFRGSPPIPRRTPSAVWLLTAGLLVWAGLATGAWAAFPSGWRIIGFYSSYTLYLLFLLVLWVTLLAVTIVGVYVPVAIMDKWLRRWLGESDRRGAELSAVVGYAMLVSLIAWYIPPTWILGLCLFVAVVAWMIYLPAGSEGAAILWRSSPEQPVFAVPVHRVLAIVGGLAALLVFDVLLTACGWRLFGSADHTTMPVTDLCGAVAAWFMPVLLGVIGLRLIAARRNDPARRTAPTAHVAGADRLSVRGAANAILSWGWHVRMSPTRRESGQVGVEIVPQEKSEALEFDPRWPLKLSVTDLEDGQVKQRLDRRDEIQVRRLLFRGLQKLFKRASAFKGPSGGGFWLAPHWWFLDGVCREDADGNPEDGAPPLVGPPYSRILAPRARQHAHAVLRATQVDMIFIEDGVTFRNLERVLRVVTELYDVHGGKRRAEELHFRGLPKVKVMIHEYEPGNPFHSDLYPEPKFDDLSRVRVLHVFRDRGGHEEPVEPPFDFSWTPAPALSE